MKWLGKGLVGRVAHTSNPTHTSRAPFMAQFYRRVPHKLLSIFRFCTVNKEAQK